MECYLVVKRKEILPFATVWLDLENIVLSEISQERQILHVITYMWNLESQMNVHNKTEMHAHM